MPCSYVAALAAFVFVTLSLGRYTVFVLYSSDRLQASGLLYISELIEEHSRPAKLIGQRGTYVRTPSLFSRLTSHLPLGYHCLACVALCHRCTSPPPDHILGHLPHSVFAEFLRQLASHLPIFTFIYCVLRHGHHKPLSMVHPFLSPRSLRQTQLQ